MLKNSNGLQAEKGNGSNNELGKRSKIIKQMNGNVLRPLKIQAELTQICQIAHLD